MSQSLVGPKVVKYVNENFLESQGVTAQLSNVSVENGLYVVSFNILQNGVVLQAGQVYSTLDGEKVIVGTMFDMNQSLASLQNPEETAPESYPKTEKPEVLLFVMSFCPYGNLAEEAMEPVAKLLGNYTNFALHYVIYNSNYGYQGSAYCLDNESKYCSMHGIQELNQDVRELCVAKYQPEKLWDFVTAVNSHCTYSNADSCWQNVAQGVGVDVNNTSACEKNEAFALLANEVELNDQYEARGSPYLIINGVAAQVARTPEAYKQAICSAFTNPPAECNSTLSAQGGTASGGCG
jgi:glutaredoxin